MADRFKVGDHVSWNSEAGIVSGTIIRVHTKDFDYKGHTHHATRPAMSRRIRDRRCTRRRGRHAQAWPERPCFLFYP